MSAPHQKHPRGLPARQSGRFLRIARASSRAAGNPIAFGAALGAVVVWALLGPVYGFSDTWQLVINTATTIITFLMVFLIQNSQNRDSEAMQLKLDELIRATQSAHNAVLDIEELSEAELDQLKKNYAHLARRARHQLRAGRSDMGRPEGGPNGAGYLRRRRRHWPHPPSGGHPQTDK